VLRQAIVNGGDLAVKNEVVKDEITVVGSDSINN
jgi:hypothetical protein